MLLQEILRNKGTTIHTIHPEATLDEVVKTLVHHNCGSLLVTDGGDQRNPMIGIITERDILRACASGQNALSRLQVREAMTDQVTVGASSDTVEDAMGTMTNLRIRHLPVVDQGRLAGIVSIGDIVKAQHDHLTMENHYLKTYIHGEVESVYAEAVMVRPR